MRRVKFIYILSYIGVYIFANCQPIFASTKCAALFQKSQTEAKINLHDSISTQGIDPQKLTFHIMSITDGSRLHLSASYNGVDVGAIMGLRIYANTGDSFFEVHIQLNDKFQNKKIGPLMYVLLAKYVDDIYRLPIRSNYIGTFLLLPNARSVWEKFEQLGLARINVGSAGQRYELIPSALEEKIDPMVWQHFIYNSTQTNSKPKVYSEEEKDEIKAMFNKLFGEDPTAL
jgi:hypothetical protein